MDWREILAIPLLLIISILFIFCPEFVWKMENFLTTKGGEPSEFYLVSARLMGVFLLLVTIFGSLFLAGQLFS